MRLCGQQAVWNYEEENGLLTIQGVGAMEDYTEPEQVPWNSLMQEIKVVVIRDGITTVGDYAFAGCSNLQEVTLPGSVEIVGVFSFKGCTGLREIVIPEGVRVLASKAFDPYPFILLNLVLSCVAAIQAPLIMMSQNRQEEKDRRRAENDYKVNLKTEIMIEDLYDKVNVILAKQSVLEKQLQIENHTNGKPKQE